MGNDPSKPRGNAGANNGTSASNDTTVVSNARHVKYNFIPKKMSSLKKGNNNNAVKTDNESKEKELKPVKLFVIDAHHDQNFYELFGGCKLLNGRKIQVEQAGWNDFSLTYYSREHYAVCNLRRSLRPIPNTPQNGFRTFIPDYCLVRNVCRGIGQFQQNADSRNLLYGLMLSGIPSINTFKSIYFFLDRPLMNAEIIRLNKIYGQEQFPIISMAYYPMADEMIVTPEYPLVMKIGHGHAGFGKMKLENHKQFGDLKSIIATTKDYCTAENYIEGQCDLRIQKIGSNYQAFKRESVSGNWKTNTGTSYIESIELLPRYKFWADKCSECFGGLDIVTVDVLVSKKDGKEYILEFNGTASGFGDKERDNFVLRDYVIEKMNKHFCPELIQNDDNDNDDEKINNNNNIIDEKDDNNIVTQETKSNDIIQESEPVATVQNNNNNTETMEPVATTVEEIEENDVVDNSNKDENIVNTETEDVKNTQQEIQDTEIEVQKKTEEVNKQNNGDE